ncbi:MAG: hypothetical protein QOG15_1969 [Solirubrobacteraceae bacterium]|nr:hypothetical protein [Solirubrobacteraceae bacterium]
MGAPSAALAAIAGATGLADSTIGYTATLIAAGSGRPITRQWADAGADVMRRLFPLQG